MVSKVRRQSVESFCWGKFYQQMEIENVWTSFMECGPQVGSGFRDGPWVPVPAMSASL
ncbi:hypothetical protein M378DRAFT_167672 [Amanita muscaria Koide BX008]|uniref:Uncharacterized protein n=1 Tax=Amanita muscaria (strain Koide BX008) TaxID=946122 RepID=A0A0C2WVN0_AMAMK|nr:hypothetical protein M378DRAFT_167672 [Amanita muscaria Koide BX008]